MAEWKHDAAYFRERRLKARIAKGVPELDGIPEEVFTRGQELQEMLMCPLRDFQEKYT